MAYVYFHYLPFETTPFYVGIGSDKNHLRAYDFKERTATWKNYCLTENVIVKIIQDDITWEDACKIENEYIKVFGRLNNKTGCLVNKNNGGKPRPLIEKQKTTLTVRVNDDLKDFLTQLADQNMTTVSRICSKILNEYYETNSSSKTTNLTQKSSNSIGNAKKRTK
jgi:hypothetical protein